MINKTKTILAYISIGIVPSIAAIPAYYILVGILWTYWSGYYIEIFRDVLIAIVVGAYILGLYFIIRQISKVSKNFSLGKSIVVMILGTVIVLFCHSIYAQFVIARYEQESTQSQEKRKVKYKDIISLGNAEKKITVEEPSKKTDGYESIIIEVNLPVTINREITLEELPGLLIFEPNRYLGRGWVCRSDLVTPLNYKVSSKDLYFEILTNEKVPYAIDARILPPGNYYLRRTITFFGPKCTQEDAANYNPHLSEGNAGIGIKVLY